MAVRWTITFKTLKNHTGLVKVYDSTYSGSAIALVPAADAFTVDRQMTDFFQPVVDESGYLNIQDNGVAAQAIEAIHPDGAFDRPVEFYVDNVLEWRGFISTEAFTTDFTPAPRVVSFPVVGALSVLEAVTIQDSNTGLQDIAAFFKEILTATQLTWDGITVGAQMRSVKTSLDTYLTNFPEFRLSVSRYLFVTYNDAQNYDDPDWSAYVGDTYLDVLRKICLYFGWTASQKGTTLILTNSRLDCITEGFYKISWSDLTALAADPDADVTRTSVTRPILALTSLDFDGVSHRKSIRNGQRKVTVQTNVSEATGLYPKILFDGEEDAFFETETPFDNIGGARIDIFGKVKFLNIDREHLILYSYKWDEDVQFFVPETWAAVSSPYKLHPRADVVRVFTYTQTPTGPAPKDNYFNTLRLARCEKVSGNWKQLPDNKPLAVIEAPAAGYFAAGGAICLDGRAYNNFYAVRTPDPDQPSVVYWDEDGLTEYDSKVYRIRASVKIGSKYFNGTEWGDTAVILNIPVSGARITDNNEGRYDGAIGYVMPITEDLIGRLSITFYISGAVNDNNPIGSVNADYIYNISLQYYNNALLENKSLRGVYLSRLTGISFISETSAALSLSTSPAKMPPVPSNAFIFWEGEIIGDKDIFIYGGSSAVTLAQPEYWLLDSMAKVYGHTAEWLEVEVSYDNSIQLYSIVTHNSKNYIVIGINTDYDTEHTTLRLLSYE